LKDTWIFDLDNTLHDAQAKIFPLINKKMNEYISTHLKISIKNSCELRKKYWELYGATLKGLIKHHNVNPIDFLEKTHYLENIGNLVVPMPNLVKVLSSIKGRKILYTNAPKNYVVKILEECKINSYFEGIFSIEDSNFLPKPSNESMKLFLNKYKVKEAFFVDDIKENLKTASQHGISTIWLTDEEDSPQFIDRKITKLIDLIKS
jgi:putative hydrolase of the HAD superfamily